MEVAVELKSSSLQRAAMEQYLTNYTTDQRQASS